MLKYFPNGGKCMYYGFVMLAVLMFGAQFYLNDKYQKENGTDAGAAFTFNFIGALVGGACLAFISGFDFSLTPFAFLMALFAAVNAVLFGICSLKALEKVNLSVYSLFSMLGGMILPFVSGIAFYGEPMTLAKGICIALIVTALLFTVDWKEKSGGGIYYVGVFISNGMSGVLSKIYEASELPKISSAGYSLWTAAVSAVLCAVALVIVGKKVKKPNFRAVLFSAGGGVLNRIANLILLIALAVLPASAQYPLVTGGVMIVSTAISALSKQKPSKKTLFSLALSCVGIIALVTIPI